ncbi:MAG: hypothetical protein ACTSRS_10505 [Candidatus Helarchaeota archaeon]
MVEVLVQEERKGIDMVDFAIACIRGLRNLKKKQEEGKLDSLTYFYIMQDIENVIHEVTKSFFFIFDGLTT